MARTGFCVGTPGRGDFTGTNSFLKRSRRMRDQHRRRTKPARYHDNRRHGFEADDWRLDQLRGRVRGGDREGPQDGHRGGVERDGDERGTHDA